MKHFVTLKTNSCKHIEVNEIQQRKLLNQSSSTLLCCRNNFSETWQNFCSLLQFVFTKENSIVAANPFLRPLLVDLKSSSVESDDCVLVNCLGWS